MKMGCCKMVFLAFVAAAWPGVFQVIADPAAPTSGCVQCHTDVKQLIRLSWEVERVRGKPTVSAEIEGEG